MGPARTRARVFTQIFKFFLLFWALAGLCWAQSFEVIEQGDKVLVQGTGGRFLLIQRATGALEWDIQRSDLSGARHLSGLQVLAQGKLWDLGPEPSSTLEFEGNPEFVAAPFFATKEAVYRESLLASPEFEIKGLTVLDDGVLVTGDSQWLLWRETGSRSGQGRAQVVEGQVIWHLEDRIGGDGWTYTGKAPVKLRRGLDFILSGKDSDYAVRLTSEGRPLFRRALPGRVSDWTRLDSGLTLYALEEPGAVGLVWMDERGLEKNRAKLDGELGALSSDLLYLITKFDTPSLDRKGRPVMNLKDGTREQLTVNGHALYRCVGVTLEEISQDRRQTLVGPTQSGPLYATQYVPERQEGVAAEVDRRFPYEPVLLKGKSWVWEPESKSVGLSKDRLPDGSWPRSGENIILSTEDDHLIAISADSGSTAWKSSSQLKFDESAPNFFDGETLLAQTREGELHYLYGLDPATGAVKWELRLTKLFLAARTNNLVGVLIVAVALGYFIFAAKRRELFIRRIAGLNALDEAVGRATEMGKPVLYVTGLADVDDIQTLASLSILGHVAKRTAEYDTPILVPTSRAVVYSAATEVVKEAYTAAGRPDAFISDNVRYLTDDQFGYTAGIDGLMLREKPAANFYIGRFYAESLILAETGNATGAIQIAGTAMPSQLPFFVAACDYTLIGEELFAASAYLSKDPLQVGSLRGQDVGKAIVMVCILVGAVCTTYGFDFIKGLFAT